MLGTNELKAVYNKTVEEIGDLIEKYFNKVILNRKSQFLETTPKLIIVTPPLVNETTDYCKNKYEGATLKSQQLNDVYKNLSIKYNCLFINNEEFQTGIDGVHLNEKKHKLLDDKIYQCLKKETNE